MTKRRTPRRDPRTGLFMKSGAKRRASAGESRRRPRRRNVSVATPRMRTRTVYAPAPAPRRRRRSSRRAAPRRAPRRSSTNIAIVPVGVREGSRRRRGGSRRRRRGLGEMFAWDAPRAGLGGLVAMAIGIVVGAEVADLWHRWAMTYSTTASPAPQLPAGITTIAAYNQAALGAKPNMMSIGGQLGLAVLGVLGGMFLPWSPVRMFSYGVAFGSVGHLGVQLLNGYIIEPLMHVGTAQVSTTGARLFAFENIAGPAINPPAATTTTTTTTGTSSGPPARSVAASAPADQPKDRVPASLGAAPASMVPGNNGRQPVPVYQPHTAGPPMVNMGNGGGGGNTATPAAPPATNTAQPLPSGGSPAAPPTTTTTTGGGTSPMKPCKRGGMCGPSCTTCGHGGAYGDPPLPAVKPHPLHAALRAA